MTLAECLERAASSSEGVRFLVRGEARFFSYRLIAERAARVAGSLRRMGVVDGDRVAIAVPTGIAFYDAFFGAVCAGAVPASLPLPPRFGERRLYEASLASMIEALSARVVLTGSRAVEALPAAEPFVAVGAREDLALIQFSSGTLDRPKAIGLTHRQILANVRAIEERFLETYPEEDGFRHSGVSWLPLYHDMGLVGAVLTALVHPSTQTLMTPDDFVSRPARWLRAISTHRATVSAAPNFAYDHCVERIRDEDLEGVDLSSWLIALDGSEPVSGETLSRFYERFRRYGLREEALTPVYGLAEAGLAVSFSELERPYFCRSFDRDALLDGRVVCQPLGQKLVSCGKPLPGLDVRIEAVEGRVGRILVRGESVVEGYLSGGTSRAVSDDRWLDTGDRGFVFESGLFIVGRSDDVIVLRGRNYAPELIERALDGIEGFGAVAAARLGDDSGFCVVAERTGGREGDGALIDAVEARLSERLGIVPEKILLVERGAIPRTSSGKIRRQALVRTHQELLKIGSST